MVEERIAGSNIRPTRRLGSADRPDVWVGSVREALRPPQQWEILKAGSVLRGSYYEYPAATRRGFGGFERQNCTLFQCALFSKSFFNSLIDARKFGSDEGF